MSTSKKEINNRIETDIEEILKDILQNNPESFKKLSDQSAKFLKDKLIREVHDTKFIRLALKILFFFGIVAAATGLFGIIPNMQLYQKISLTAIGLGLMILYFRLALINNNKIGVTDIDMPVGILSLLKDIVKEITSRYIESKENPAANSQQGTAE